MNPTFLFLLPLVVSIRVNQLHHISPVLHVSLKSATPILTPTPTPTPLTISISFVSSTISAQVTTTSSTIYESFIKDFFNFEKSKFTSQSSNDNIVFKTAIKNYENTLSDPNDLKNWVKQINNEGTNVNDLHNEDYQTSYKKYSHSKIQSSDSKLQHQSNEDKDFANFNIDEFIAYLIKEKNFQPQELTFLKLKYNSSNLDYGFDEIEKELNKINNEKRNSQESNKNIQIGGEHDNDKPVSGGFNKILNIWILLIVLIFNGLFFI